MKHKVADTAIQAIWHIQNNYYNYRFLHVTMSIILLGATDYTCKGQGLFFIIMQLYDHYYAIM